MKKETAKKKWLWIVLAALIAAAGVAVALVLILGGSFGGSDEISSALYWNVDRASYAQNSATGMSSRTPDEDGIYRIRFFHDGIMEHIPVANKQLVNTIDTKDAIGLIFDENGVIIELIDAKKIAKEVTKKCFVQKVENNVIYANASIAFNGMNHKLKLEDNVGIYDVDPTSATVGQMLTAAQLQFTDALVAYGNTDGELTQIFLTSRAKDTPVYWRYDRQYADGSTTRMPDADGVFSVPFAAEGKLVTVQTKVKALVDEMDYMGYLSPHYAFVFDEKGYVTEVVSTQAGLFGMLACERLEVHQLDGRTFTAEGMYESDVGKTYTATLPDDCPIYDVSEAALREGRFGQEVDSLQMHDRVTVWTDPDGVPAFVYVQNRLVGPGYWVYPGCQRDPETNETLRKPNAQGWYEIQLIKNGEAGVKTYKTQDKELVNYLDAQGGTQVVGLKTDGDIILQVYNSEAVYGYGPFWRGATVTNILGNLVTLSGSPTHSATVVLAESFAAYDMSGISELGSTTELKVGDVVESHRDLSGQIMVSYVTRRYLGGESLYYNIGGYQYDSKKGETTRAKDDKGYYVYTMVNYKGETVTLKTKDKKIASAVDTIGHLCMSLVVEKGVIKNVLDASFAYGKFLTSYMMVEKIDSDGMMHLRAIDSEYSLSVKTGSDMTILNLSSFYEKKQGEKVSKVKVGDVIACFSDASFNVKMIYIRDKMMPDLLWAAQRSGFETPVPDAEGWYTVQALKNGKLVTYKTKSLDVVNAVNSKTGAFALYTKNDEILAVTNEYHVRNLYPQANGWDVVSVSGRKVTVQYNYPGDKDNTGKQFKFTMNKKVKIYDVSPTAETYGAVTTLQPGDTIVSYKDPTNEQAMYVFVKFRENRENGVDGYCTHCGTEVHWCPWNGGGTLNGGHYYLNGDASFYGAQATIGTAAADVETVIDLNGKKLSVYGQRAFLVHENDTLSIIDSVGGGEINATGLTGGASGGLAMISGGTLNLFSGTLRLQENESCAPSRGGVMALFNANFNMYGGQVIGGQIAPKGTGGSIHVDNSNVTIAGGQIIGGKAGGGGNIYISENVDGVKAKVLITDDGDPTTPAPVISGGKASNGGNIYVAGAMIANAGSITGGTSTNFGGNIYYELSNLENVLGGTLVVADGTSPGGGNICSYQAYLTLDGCTITGGKATGEGHEYFYGGGNIYMVNAALTFKGGEIANGYCDNNSGGNLILREAYLFMSDGIIRDGQSTKQGGNIYAHAGATVELSNGTISGGKAANGGSVRLEDATVFNMAGGTVSGGEATSQGGNFNLRSNGTTLNITGGTISGGTSTYQGGSIYCNPGAVLNISGGTISGGTSTYNGGNLALEETTFTMTGGAIANGQALNGGNILLFSGTKATISGGTISGGKATEKSGGNLMITGASTKLTVNGGEISSGVAPTLGGNIHVTAATVELAGGTLFGGSAKDGGAIRMDGGAKVDISGATVRDGVASSQGGNINLKETGTTLIISGGTVSGGTSTNQGGNIYCNSGTAVTITGGTVSGGKTANSYGGNLAVEAATVTMTDGEITDGQAIRGGNIYLFYGATANISGGTISNGVASNQGGNIHMGSHADRLIMTGGTLSGGTTSGDGGNLFVGVAAASAELSNVTVTGGVGSATSGGGGNIYSAIPITLTGCTISSGTAAYGPNIYAEKDLTLDGTTLSGGYSYQRGGKLILAGNSQIHGVLMSAEAGLLVKQTFTGTVRLDGVAKPEPLYGGKLNTSKYTCEAPFAGTVWLDDFAGKPYAYGIGTELIVSDPSVS